MPRRKQRRGFAVDRVVIPLPETMVVQPEYFLREFCGEECGRKKLRLTSGTYICDGKLAFSVLQKRGTAYKILIKCHNRNHDRVIWTADRKKKMSETIPSTSACKKVRKAVKEPVDAMEIPPPLPELEENSLALERIECNGETTRKNGQQDVETESESNGELPTEETCKLCNWSGRCCLMNIRPKQEVLASILVNAYMYCTKSS